MAVEISHKHSSGSQATNKQQSKGLTIGAQVRITRDAIPLQSGGVCCATPVAITMAATTTMVTVTATERRLLQPAAAISRPWCLRLVCYAVESDHLLNQAVCIYRQAPSSLLPQISRYWHVSRFSRVNVKHDLQHSFGTL